MEDGDLNTRAMVSILQLLRGQVCEGRAGAADCVEAMTLTSQTQPSCPAGDVFIYTAALSRNIPT